MPIFTGDSSRARIGTGAIIVAALHANPVLSTERRAIGRTYADGAFPVVGFKASAPNQPDID
jgi:hypothetical protein